MSDKVTPHPIDVQVGINLRRIRNEKGVSQQTLAALLGISFQQIQKYERAKNRVSASILYRIAEVLAVHPMAISPDINSDLPDPTLNLALANQIGARRLISYYSEIHSRSKRKALLALAQVMAHNDKIQHPQGPPNGKSEPVGADVSKASVSHR